MNGGWTAAQVAERLGGRRAGSGWTARCPSHNDKNASLSIGEGSNGKWLVRCHAGCGQADVVDAVKKLMAGGGEASASPPVVRNGNGGKVVATYDYVDAAGQELYQVVRKEPKEFLQRRRNSGGDPSEPTWSFKLEGVMRVLYRLPEVNLAVRLQREGKYREPIFIVEGEKDADALANSPFGLIATTNSGGAAATWTQDYTDTLRGATFVTVLPDNDEPGRKHAEAVAGALQGAVGKVKVLTLPGLPDKGDVSDWIAAGGTKERLLRLADEAAPYVSSVKGKSLKLVPYSSIPRKRVSWLWKFFFPFGKLVVVDGDPDLGKSTLMLNVAAGVTNGKAMPDGSPGCEAAGVLVMSNEDDDEDTIGPRLMAAGADMDKVFRANFALDGARHEPTICVEDIALIEEHIRQFGIRLVIIDPMTAYLDGNVRVYVDQDVRRALLPLKGLAERTGCAVVVIRHWTKDTKRSALHRGGGSVGITGAARQVLCVALDPNDSNENWNLRKRVLAVVKSNNGGRPLGREFTLEYVPEHDTCRIAWGGPSKLSADELSIGPMPEETRKLTVAKDFLRDTLGNGEVKEEAVQVKAKEEDIAPRTLRRAKEELEVLSRMDESGTFWWWSLPEGGHASTAGRLPMKTGSHDGHLGGRTEVQA